MSGRSDRVAAVVVLLHGGTGPARSANPDLNPAFQRLTPFGWAIRMTSRRRLAVVQPYNPAGGWAIQGRDGPGAARALLDHVRAGFRGLPIGLLGHSSGGWAALMAGGEPDVRSVVALAPWLSGKEPVEHLLGRRVLLVHGARDSVTNPRLSNAYVRRLDNAGVDAHYVEVPQGDHPMLRNWRIWHRLAVRHTVQALLR